MPTPEDFDGCNSECRHAGQHTLRWGGCEHAAEPEPTVSMSVVYRDHDGQNSIGFDSYTVPQLGELITAGLQASDLPVNGDDLVDVGLVAAHAIIHRNDANNAEQCPRTIPDNPPTSSDTPDNLRRYRTWLAAEHAKALRAAEHPRPDLDHLRVTAPNGIVAGLEIAMHGVDCMLGETRPAHDAGPTVAECRQDDRAWPLQLEGE